MKYRSSLDIISTVLKIVLTPEATKTKVMYGSSLSYNQTVEYLDLLLSKEIIEFDDETHYYRITEKGIDLLRKSNELLSMISGRLDKQSILDEIRIAT